MTTPDNLPPLPGPFDQIGCINASAAYPQDPVQSVDVFSSDQMRTYGQQCAQAAIAAERGRCAELVRTFPHWLGPQGRKEIAEAILAAPPAPQPQTQENKG